MRTKITTLAMAAAIMTGAGCQTVEERPDPGANPFEGTWAGKNRFRPRVEVQIEKVRDDRTIEGTLCWRETSGAIRGQRLEQIAQMSESGLSTHFDMGSGKFHIRTEEGKLVMWETRVRPNGTLTRPLRTRLGRTRSPECAARYLRETIAASPPPRDEANPIVGAWTGRWGDGTTAEVEVTSATSKWDFDAIYCTRSRSGEITIYDLEPRGPLKARFDADTHSVAFEEKTRGGTIERRLEVRDGHTARLSRGRMKKRVRANVESITMMRGAHDGGCLRRSE